MTKFVITETLLSSIIVKTTIMVSLHRGRFVVVHLYSTFAINPQNFPLPRGKFLPKITIFGHFGGRKTALFKATMAKFGMRVRSRDFFPRQNFVKIS